MDRLVERLSRGDFDPDSGALGASGGSAGGAGEAGGGISPMRGGGGAVSYDYDQVPRWAEYGRIRPAHVTIPDQACACASLLRQQAGRACWQPSFACVRVRAASE